MTFSQIPLIVLGLALWGSAPESTSTRTENARNDNTAIEATLKQYEAALNASDVDSIMALYTEDGVFMPTEAPTTERNNTSPPLPATDDGPVQYLEL